MRKIISACLFLLLSVSTASTAATWYAAMPAAISCTFTNGSAAIAATNSFVAGDVVEFQTTGALPTNFSTATPYFVISTGLSSSQFEVSASYGGTAISAGSAGTSPWTVTGYSVDLLVWKSTQGASCANSGTQLTWPDTTTQDVLDVNGCTGIYVTADPGSSSVFISLSTDATNTGGGYTYPVAANTTLHVYNITSTKSTVLTISGSTGGGTIQCGSTGAGTITGGSATSDYGVSDTHTSVTVTYDCNFVGGSNNGYAYYNNAASSPVTIVGSMTGGASSAIGVLFGGSHTGAITLTGNAVAGSGAMGFQNTGPQAVTMTGNCVGIDSVAESGCYVGSGSTLTLTGSIFNGRDGSGVYFGGGALYFTPGATGCVTFASGSSESLQTSCPSSLVSSVTTLAPVLAGYLGNTGNVANGLQYGGMTGTASAGSSVSIVGCW